MSDRDVDAVDIGVFLIDDGVDSNRCLTCLTVTDNQLALSASDWDHCINCFDSSLQRLFDGLSIDNSRSIRFKQAELFGDDRPLPVKGQTKCADDAANQRFTNRDLDNLTGPLDGVPFFDIGVGAKNNCADVIFFQV